MPTECGSSQDTLDGCQTLQQEEYEVLESIYPEYVSSQLKDGTLKLEVPVEFDQPRHVIIQDTGSKAEAERVSVSTLPPLLIHVSLPPAYPVQEAPQISFIRATHLWLPRPDTLVKHLTGMWRAGEGVLYSWIECLRTGEFLGALEMQSGAESDIEIISANPSNLANLLNDHEKISQSSQFAKNAYECSVCLATLKGSKCLRLSCEHVFCRPCLQDFWGLCIEEGDVSRVGCPDPACVKQKREADAEEVARVVSDEEVARWRWLKEKRDIEKDPTIVHCPVDNCQAPVKKPANEDPESGWARFRQCSRCNFTFCAFCRRTWHGPISPCVIAHSEKVVLEYLAADEGSEERDNLEQRYGRGNLMRLVHRYQEEMANKEWLDRSTTECPGCSCRVEKNLGCNHMTCWKCGKHFCYRCGAAIPGHNPYEHFSQPGRCYQKLFDYDSQDLEWEDMGGIA